MTMKTINSVWRMILPVAVLFSSTVVLAQNVPPVATVPVAPPVADATPATQAAAPDATPAVPLDFIYAGKFNPVDPNSPNVYFGGSPVAEDHSGNLYLAVYNYGAVEYDRTQNFVGVAGYPTALDGKPALRTDGTENRPRIITRGFRMPPADLSNPDGQPWILVNDTTALDIQGHLFRAKLISVDSRGRIWVFDDLTKYLQSFDGTGSVAYCFPINAEGGVVTSDTFGGLVADRAKVFISDVADGLVDVYKETGAPLKPIGQVGTGTGELTLPGALAVEPDGTLLVVDTNNYRVSEFTEAGKFVRSFGTQGTGDGQFSSMRAIAVDGKSRIYVADASRVEVFTEKGDFVTKIAATQKYDHNLLKSSGENEVGLIADAFLTTPTSLAVAHDGTVFVVDGNQIKMFKAHGG